MKDPTIYNVRVIERAMQILSCFDDERPEMGIAEISQLVHLPKPTVLRILVTLLNGGYVERAVDGERYRLGLRLMEMGLGVVRRLDFRRKAKPYMVTLEERFEETCDLSVFSRGEMMNVEVVQSRHALRIAGSPGYRSPAHCTASGKVFLAFMSADALEWLLSRPLKRYTDKTITSPRMLTDQFAEIRASGYAIDDEELSVGVRAVAVPIRDRSDKIVAAIGIPGPKERMGASRMSEIAAALIEVANLISDRAGRD